MVPFGTKAFMPGELVHTNEVMVLLGENYFAERSAKQANEIANRRGGVAASNHQLARREMERMQARRGFSTMVQTEEDREGLGVFDRGDGQFDIREEYHSDDEEAAAAPPAPTQRAPVGDGVAEGSAKDGAAGAKDPVGAPQPQPPQPETHEPNLGDFFARLDALEKLEAAEGHITVMAAGSDGGSDSDDNEDDDGGGDEDRYREPEPVVEHAAAAAAAARAAHPQAAAAAAPQRTIKVTHTKGNEKRRVSFAESVKPTDEIVGPGDLYSRFGADGVSPTAAKPTRSAASGGSATSSVLHDVGGTHVLALRCWVAPGLAYSQ
jgi:hypothetical protein